MKAHDTIQTISATDNLFIAQYTALRAEILQLMLNNEQRTIGVLGFSGVLWSVLATLLGNKMTVPGIAFLSPLPLALAGLNSYVALSRRIANIGAFLGAATLSYAPTMPNWEREVGIYAQQSNNRMSTRKSTIAVYWMVLTVGILAATSAASVNITKNSWAWLDLGGSLLLGTSFAVGFALIQRVHRSYADTRMNLDTYWQTRLSTGSDRAGDA